MAFIHRNAAHGSLCPFPQRAYEAPLCNHSTAGRGQPGWRGRQLPATTLVPMIHSPGLQFPSFFPSSMSSLQLSWSLQSCGGVRGGGVAGEGLSESYLLVCEAQTGRSPAPLVSLWPRAGGTGAPQDAPLYFSSLLGRGGSPSGGGAPEPRIASRRVPGGVARAAQDSRLPPPAVGAALLPPRPITALGPAGWDGPSGPLDTAYLPG